jgi:uncharacterized protein
MRINRFRELFPEKSIIGMIHLAGRDKAERVSRAIKEMIIYQEEGVRGAIIEDYHGSLNDMFETLKQSSTLGFTLVRGVNVLRDPYSSFKLASQFGARFVQFDSVQNKDLDLEQYNRLRTEFPNISVLGGVGFKYISPTGNPLEVDLREGISKCEAIVTTGSGTGIETPTEKLREYKRLLGDFPLVVGAGVDLQNAYEQMQVCDGAIIGSYFKPNGNTHLPIDRAKIRSLVDAVRKI